MATLCKINQPYSSAGHPKRGYEHTNIIHILGFSQRHVVFKPRPRSPIIDLRHSLHADDSV